jgi:hypothetical protein
MRVVRKMEELAPAFESATREAESAFGNGSVFVERYVRQSPIAPACLFGSIRQVACSITCLLACLVRLLASPLPPVDKTFFILHTCCFS